MKKLLEQGLAGAEKLEIRYGTRDGKSITYLNFWDWAHGNDVVCQIIDGEIREVDENDHPTGTITFSEFLDKVADSILKRTV